MALLGARYYITTNYDRLLEGAFAKIHGARFADTFLTVTQERDLPSLERYAHVCVKLHGDVKQHDLLVLTQHQYLQRARQPTRVDSLVQYLFAVNTVLFVGYDLRDPHIVDLIAREREIASPDLPAKYIVLPSYIRQRNDQMKALGVVRKNRQ